MPTISNLSESDVPQLAGQTYADRGDRYQREGRVVGPRRTDDRLIAMCQGSQPTPYRVEVVIDEHDDIERTSCTCPVAGTCKHVAALLYEWIRNPEGFGPESELEAKFRGLSRDRLVELLVNLVERNPQLRGAVELQLTTVKLAGEEADGTADYDEFYRQADEILRSQTPRGLGWRHTEVPVREIGSLFSSARQFLEDDQPQNGGIVAAALLECMLEYFDIFAGDDNYAREMSEAAELLARMFEAIPEPRGRTQILPHLWNAWRWDVDFGGIGVAYPIEDVLLETAGESERDQLIEWLDDYLAELDAGESTISSWRRGEIAEFALELEAESLDDEAYVERCRELGDVPRLVDALLSVGEFDEAKERASEVGVGELLRLTDIFIAYGRDGDAVELVEIAAKNSESYEEERCRRWLREYFEHREESAEALPHALREFESRPTVDNLEAVRRLAENTGEWEEMREECLDALEVESPAALMDWYLHVDDPRAALEVWEEYDSPFRYFSTTLPKLADSIADSHPEVAIDIRAELADRLIARRGRNNYREACKHFARIRDVYRDQDRPGEFSELVEWLYDEHNRLPAFKDEMRKAGLAPEE